MENFDHRVLGINLNLFRTEDALGSVFWHPRGYLLYSAIENYMRKQIAQGGYREVRSPMVMPRSSWEKSGHWDIYRENMFSLVDEKHQACIKPMNCPGHVQIFNQNVRSWRDLPIRLAEFGLVHRNEPSGSLHGLLRLRGFVQDDGHIFCEENQINQEVSKFCSLLKSVYKDFGFDQPEVSISLRPDKKKGSNEQWDRAESLLENAAHEAGLKIKSVPGEGAFYGPKLEFSLKDQQKRVWQCGTLQLDIVLPSLLGVKYIDQRGEKNTPVLIHRAVLGSMERFIGILLEHWEGKLPFWIAPEQVVVLPVKEQHQDKATNLENMLESKGIRVNKDIKKGWLSQRIKEARSMQIPVTIVIGDREKNCDLVSIRFEDKVREMSFQNCVDFLLSLAKPPSKR